MTKHLRYKAIDGNEAVASVAYRLNEVIAIYPITPSSSMGEWADVWASGKSTNLWGTIPSVMEMQSETGAAGAVHGALQTGSLCTTFTCSQGLMLMLPNLYKIAGELTPAVFHVAARALATHALSIFGDQSDIMAARSTGTAQLCSASVQEAHDFALIAQAATLESRIPFIHFFDGFRTSHEISKIEMISDDVLAVMIPEEQIAAHRARALSPDHPVLRGTAQNPDVYFQSREAVNPFYAACPAIVQAAMDRFAELTGRAYKLFEYHGAPDAERVIVLMGSGADTVHETIDHLNDRGGKVGLLKVRLFRPFDAERFVAALPKSVESIAVLDRAKEPGSTGEPMYLDCVTAFYEAWNHGMLPLMPRIVGGRYGLSSKEFTPAMVKAVFENLANDCPKKHFTVGIQDDVAETSLDFDPEFSIEPPDVYRAMFYGLGSDGTVGANKDSIKIIGEQTKQHIQGYFVYDSKKSGATTISHLRFGPRPIRSEYLINRANFIACHHAMFLERYDMLENLEKNGVFLLNTPHSADSVWENLPESVQQQLIDKEARLFVIDASKVARAAGLGGRINTVMQTCFFKIAGVLPVEQALDAIKDSIRKTYQHKGAEVIEKNIRAVDGAVEALEEVRLPMEVRSRIAMRPPVPTQAPDFVRCVLGEIIAGRGDRLPVSAFPPDGTYPTATAQWEKRSLALDVPVWNSDICIQCGKCVFVCPHAAIRSKVYDNSLLEAAPAAFQNCDARLPRWKGLKYTLQVAPDDCTGCGICVDVCPVRDKAHENRKAIEMAPLMPQREVQRANWDYFTTLPDKDRREAAVNSVREEQVLRPLFEFSGACAGCGETPYLKLLTQLFGDRLLVANATGCSSIYGGNLPTTPWSKNAAGRGPAWSNSLFEDNAEFGLGFRLSIDKQREFARELLKQISGIVGVDLAEKILSNPQKTEAEIFEQREAVAALKTKLQALDTVVTRRLLTLADALVKRSVWIVGGDGWAYDIGFGGLDHVLASGRDVNVLVLDTQVYSNTGGQMSKATPRGAIARFAAGGKPLPSKDLGLMAMTYGHIYVASVAMGAKDEQTLKAFLEAEAFPGPSLILAYSHCIAHGIEMGAGMQHQKAAVQSGNWLLFRYNPERAVNGQNPLVLDSPAPNLPMEQYFTSENRFKLLSKSQSNGDHTMFNLARQDAEQRWRLYQHLASQGRQQQS